MMTNSSVDTRIDTRIDAPFIESSLSSEAAELRARMATDGYLFFRALVPAETILEVRRDVLQECEEAGWLDPTREMMDAAPNPDCGPYSQGSPEYMPTYRRILKTPSFDQFPTHPALMQVAAKLLDLPLEEVFPHPRRIGRVTWPNFAEATTPPHQDFFYIRGAVDTYSCWMPLGECPTSLGGLAVWPGSHRLGFVEHTEHLPGATGGRGVPVDEAQAVWHSSDFGVGDALFFTSYTIHKALPNLSGNRLRLSTDNRYQRPKDAIDPTSLLPHFGK